MGDIIKLLKTILDSENFVIPVLLNIKKGGIMPWPKGDYPPSYKNQPKYLREKAVEIANEILKESGDEGISIATGLKKAREYFRDQPEQKKTTNPKTA